MSGEATSSAVLSEASGQTKGCCSSLRARKARISYTRKLKITRQGM